MLESDPYPDGSVILGPCGDAVVEVTKDKRIKKDRKMLNSEMSCWNSVAFFSSLSNLLPLLQSVRNPQLHKNSHNRNWSLLKSDFLFTAIPVLWIVELLIHTCKCTGGFCVCFAFILYLLEKLL